MKVFCIGFHKTGTSSLKVALKKLGYRVTGPNGIRDPEIATNVHAMADKLVKQFDAFQDNPWPFLYKEMDSKYPGSKFIMTVRDTDSWIKSSVNHFGKQETPMRKWIYGVGSPMGNEKVYTTRFDSHTEEVTNYFKDRPADLLVMDLSRGDGWRELCDFLGKDVPNESFPHANKTHKRNHRKWVGKVMSIFKSSTNV